MAARVSLHTNENMPTTYPDIYFPVVVQIVIAIAVAAGLIGASTLLGKRGKSPLKDTPYESGMAPAESYACISAPPRRPAPVSRRPTPLSIVLHPPPN